MKTFIGLCFLFSMSLATAKETEKKQESGLKKQYEAFILERDALLYRRPLLASPPAEGIERALEKGTELLILYVSKNKEWSFVKSRDQKSGWVPRDWISAKYKVNPVEVRQAFFPKPDETMIDPTYEWQNEVSVWGDDLLLQALEK